MFNKDLLLVDIEATGLDYANHDMIQLAAVLLDKKTLEQKKVFSTYIRPLSFRNWQAQAMAINGITKQQLLDAPSLKTVMRKFNKLFGRNVILTYYASILDVAFLHTSYRRAGMKYPFDYHSFNIWGTFYIYLAKKRALTNRKKFSGFTLDDLMKRFKIKPYPRHDALGDVMIEAEILRYILKEVKI